MADNQVRGSSVLDNFLMLAPEVRLMIYKEIFDQTAVLITLRPARQNIKPSAVENIDPSLLRDLQPAEFSIRKPYPNLDDTPQRAANIDLLYLCRTIRAEALPAFYGSLTISFFQPELYEYFVKALPPQRRLYIKHVALDLGFNWLHHEPDAPRVLGRPDEPYKRTVWQTGLPDRPLQQLFTDDANDKSWDNLLLPSLECLEARMWSFVRVFASDDELNLLNHKCNTVIPKHVEPVLNGQIMKMAKLREHLQTSSVVEGPRSLLQTGPELTWRVSIHQFLACLNVGLRKPGLGQKREFYLGDAGAIYLLAGAGIEDPEGHEKFRGLTSWGR